MPQTMVERIAIMGEVIKVMTTSGFIYDLGSGYSNWSNVPPPFGTKMNCQAAARLAKRLAEEKYGLEKPELQIVKVSPKGGFIVEAGRGQKAFGSTAPQIQTTDFQGYEFDNHYRLKDLGAAGKVYDPTFGTSGNLNPTGIAASSETERINDGLGQQTVYGEKYLVKRTTKFEVFVLANGPVPQKWIVSDTQFG